MAVYVDTVYNAAESFTGFPLLLATVLFTFQIYCDFSGYSDIAVGTAELLDIDLMTNFKSPYFSASIREFWSRWHISLSTWFRDYVYIPLGGNRKGRVRTYVNCLIVFFLSGIWHGAGWQFIVWGMMHGVLFVLTRARRDVGHGAKRDAGLAHALCVLATFLYVNIAWIFFRAPSVKEAVALIKNIAGFPLGKLIGSWQDALIWMNSGM